MRLAATNPRLCLCGSERGPLVGELGVPAGGGWSGAAGTRRRRGVPGRAEPLACQPVKRGAAAVVVGSVVVVVGTVVVVGPGAVVRVMVKVHSTSVAPL